jgi:hypothetical protein
MPHSFSLKPLSKDAIPAALAKAERYRLLNEPGEAESICLDVLQIDAANQDALVIMILALTDQFPEESSKTAGRASDLVGRLTDEYDRAYYAGIIRERRAKAVLHHQRYGAVVTAIDWLKEAMDCFERAERIRPAHNDDAVLRWNTCARLLMTLPEIEPESSTPEPIQLE